MGETHGVDLRLKSYTADVFVIFVAMDPTLPREVWGESLLCGRSIFLSRFTVARRR